MHVRPAHEFLQSIGWSVARDSHSETQRLEAGGDAVVESEDAWELRAIARVSL
jgi:hypothetical protein